MNTKDLRLGSWTATSGLLVLALFALGPLLFFLSFAISTERLGMFAYGMAQSVFPLICPESVRLSACYMVKGVASWWSWLLWLPIVISYGYFLRNSRIRVRIVVGIVVVVFVMATLQAILHIGGWRQYIDAV
jgi:hypothetical protein